MKNKIFFTAVIVAGLFLTSSVNQIYGQTPQNKVIKQDTVKYTCPMHPEVTQANPGKCPKCGTTLVAKTVKSKGMHHSNDSTMMKPGRKKTMPDSTKMKKGNMM
jgi:hypothetical protein